MAFNPSPPSPWFTPVTPGGSGATGVFPPGTEMIAPPGTPVMPGTPATSTGTIPLNDAIRRLLKKYGWDDDEALIYLASLEQQQAAYTASSGYQNRALQAQIDNAKRQRRTAIKTAEIAADSSRYATDTQRETAERQLAQQAAHFQQTHGLEVAKAYTQFASTPDMMWARNDFVGALDRVGQGLGPQSVWSQAPPRAKTWQDFAALSGYGGNPAVAAGQGGAQMSMDGGAGGGAGGGTDARLKAMQAVGKAIPPSDTPGADNQDWAAINAIANLYAAGRPRDVAALGPQRRKIAQAGLARAGYDPALVEEEYRRGLPNRGNSRAA